MKIKYEILVNGILTDKGFFDSGEDFKVKHFKNSLVVIDYDITNDLTDIEISEGFKRLRK